MTLTLIGFVMIAGVAAALGCYRLFAGPTRTDRVVGLDVLFAVGIVLSLCAAWASGRTVFVDVAIGLALVGFVATLAWARLIQGDGQDEEADQR